jgi:hypothetical protein
MRRDGASEILFTRTIEVADEDEIVRSLSYAVERQTLSDDQLPHCVTFSF